MVNRRFHPEVPLLRAVVKTYDAMHSLNVEVHYLSCESGVRLLPPRKAKRGPD